MRNSWFTEYLVRKSLSHDLSSTLSNCRITYSDKYIEDMNACDNMEAVHVVQYVDMYGTCINRFSTVTITCMPIIYFK